MSFILFLASLATATEPSVADADASISAAKEARSAAIEGYRKKLETSKSAAEAKLEAANTGCADARTVWLAMQEPLAATNTELKLVPLSDVSAEIAAANATYRKELEKLKAGYDAKVAAAIKAASINGGSIKVATADKEKIDAELKRLDDQEAKEAQMASKAKCEATAPRPETCSVSFDRAGGLGSFVGGGEGVSYARAALSRGPRVVYLPAEFAICFPGEVKTTDTTY